MLPKRDYTIHVDYNAIQITMHLMHSHIADFLLPAIEYDNAAVFTNIFSPICADDV